MRVPRLTIKQLFQLTLGSVWLLVMSRVPADPDLWGHVRFGLDMIAERAVRLSDTYSFTTDRPWINHEWLSEVVMAAAYGSLGAFGLNAVRLAVVLATLAVVWKAADRLDSSHRMTLVGAAALGITLRAYPVRPQIFSLLAFAILLLLLRRSEADDARRPLVLVPLVMAVWANLHGGWIVGLGAVALWTAATFALGRWRRGVALLATAGAAVAATLVNPYGVDLWRFIASTVGTERPLIGDWLPLYSLPPNFWASWLAGFGMCALVGINARQRASRPLLLITLGLGAASVRVSRLDAFFALAAAFLVTSAFAREPDRVEAPQTGSRAFGWIGSAAALTVAALSLYQARRIEVREQLAPEPQAVRFFLDNGLKGRVLTFFGWGEYAIWHLGRSGLAVSMDGRRETVYSDELVNAHLQYYFSSGNATRYPDALRADYIWLPPGLPVVAALKAEGWPVAFEGPRSIVFVRSATGVTPVRVAEAPPSRDFPGP